MLLGGFLAGGHLRLLSYRHLEKNFTFRLARPERLIRSGPYAFMQHPSYTGGFMSLFFYSGLVIRPDGVLSCWMSNGPWSTVLKGFVYFNYIFLVVAVLLTFPSRILKEEELLRQTFGTEWEEYHLKTARLIPWIF